MVAVGVGDVKTNTTYPYLSIKYHDKIVVVRYDHDEVCGNANFLFLYMKSSIAYISLCTKIG